MKLHTRVLSMLLVLMLLLSTVVACSNPGTPSTTTTTIEITTTTPGTSDSGTSAPGTSAPGTSDSGSSEPEPSTPVLATGVTLNKSETTINKGETETLTATVAPADTTDKTVAWTSSDEGVATVADTTKEWYNYENKEWANAVILYEKEVNKIKDTSGNNNDGKIIV